MKKGTLEVEARKTAKHPRVKAEIERLLLQMLPAVSDMKRAYQHSFAAILKLSIDSTSEQMRFKCACWLRRECERQSQLLAAVRPEPEEERMLAALRTLYVQIEGGASHPAQALEMVDDVADADGSPAEVAETTMAAAEVHGEAEDSERDDDHCEEEESSQPAFRRGPVPGHYPPKFKTIRVK
jgi:hypothetical protein